MIDARLGLPASLDCERAILGSLMDYATDHLETFGLLGADDFSLEANRRIYGVMLDIDRSGSKIDRIAIAEALTARKQLESVGGLTYLSGLDQGLPEFPNLESYIDTVKEKAALRRIIFAGQALVNRCMSPGESAAEIIASAEKTLLEIGQTGKSTVEEMLNPGQVVEACGGLQRFISPLAGKGVSTPFTRLTEITGGYRRGEVVIVAGNTGHGKSAISLQVGGFVAEQDQGVQFFSMEMSRSALVMRMACAKARVDSAKVRAGYINSEERTRLQKAFSAIWDLPLWIGEHGASTVLGIRSALRRQRQKRDVFMLVIDYLQLMSAVGKFQNRNAEITEITRGIKLLAMDENVNILLLSQLNRDNVKEKRAPALHDLRESGSIEQNGDCVQFVWRPEMLPNNRDREDLRGQAELIVAKQRDGPIATIKLSFLANLVKFENAIEDLPEYEPPQRRFDHDD